jgi:NTP pyrophosphatase (non-canonical NTP hydrolase)
LKKIDDKDLTPLDRNLIDALDKIQFAVYVNARDKGFWDGADIKDPLVFGNKLMLTVGELAECHEVVRKEKQFLDVACPKPIDITAVGEELADTVIRVMDLAERAGIDLGRAIMLKHKYNQGRPHMHGKTM